jgi:hypothetical protein
MPEPRQVHYIRIELPPDATDEERESLWNAVTELAEKYSEEFDYDINVDGSAWYPSVDLEETTPYLVALGNVNRMLQHSKAYEHPTDAAVLRDNLQRLHQLGMSQPDMVLHLEIRRALNAAITRNVQIEDNVTTALDMVRGYVSEPMQIKFQAGTQ